MTDQPDDLLLEGEIEVLGRMPWSSNATMLVSLTGDSGQSRAVYKPGGGERPLHDFPSGLYLREIAAFELSRWLGWDLVPATVLRRDAPLGPGSLQRFVEADFEAHYFTLYEDDDFHDQLRRLCVFDLLCNNTDRKGGHCLLDGEGHVWAIDNGLSFHHQFKLRTVIWDFGGEEIPADLLDDVRRLHEDGPPPAMVTLLDSLELDAMSARAGAILAEPCFPIDHTGRRYPWPLV
ncbi:MAG: SCO1664 family protein [Acidimicrobiales bacterium]